MKLHIQNCSTFSEINPGHRNFNYTNLDKNYFRTAVRFIDLLVLKNKIVNVLVLLAIAQKGFNTIKVRASLSNAFLNFVCEVYVFLPFVLYFL